MNHEDFTHGIQKWRDMSRKMSIPHFSNVVLQKISSDRNVVSFFCYLSSYRVHVTPINMGSFITMHDRRRFVLFGRKKMLQQHIKYNSCLKQTQPP
jgi:hypothetical protein